MYYFEKELKQKTNLPQSHIASKWWGWHLNMRMPELMLWSGHDLFVELLRKIAGPIQDQALLVTAQKWYEKVLFMHSYQAPSRTEWLERLVAENITKGGLNAVVWIVQSSSQQFVLRETFNGVQVMS